MLSALAGRECITVNTPMSSFSYGTDVAGNKLTELATSFDPYCELNGTAGLMADNGDWQAGCSTFCGTKKGTRFDNPRSFDDTTNTSSDRTSVYYGLTDEYNGLYGEPPRCC